MIRDVEFKSVSNMREKEISLELMSAIGGVEICAA